MTIPEPKTYPQALAIRLLSSTVHRLVGRTWSRQRQHFVVVIFDPDRYVSHRGTNVGDVFAHLLEPLIDLAEFLFHVFE